MRLWMLAVLYGILTVAVAYFGQLHVDEGHYHAVGQLVLQGKLPFRDFIYVQAPVYPYVAAAIQAVVGGGFAAGRLAHGALGLATFALAGLLARRGGSTGVLLYGALVLPSLFTVYHLTFIKLYPVAALFLTASLVAFERDGTAFQALSLVCAALAVATRLSLAPALALLLAAGLYLNGRRVVLPALAGLGTLAAAFGPHLLLAREQMTYDILRYHFDKDAFTPRQLLVYKLDSLSAIASHYWPAILLAAAVVAGAPPLSGANPATVRRLLPWAVTAGLVGSHLLAKGPNLHLYLTAAYPYAAACLAVGAAPLLDGLGPLRPFARAGIVASFVVVMPAQARETLTLQLPSVAARVAAVARDVAAATPPGQPVIVFANSIAVAAGRPILERYEMNAVTYDPSWDAAKCRRFGILHWTELVAALDEGRVGACLVTDEAFIGNFPRFYNPGERGIRPDVMAAIERGYRHLRTYPGLAHFGRDAHLYVRASPGPGTP